MQIPPSSSVLEALSRHITPANGAPTRPAPVKPQPQAAIAARAQAIQAPAAAQAQRVASAAIAQAAHNRPVAPSHQPIVPRGSVLNILV